MKSFRGYMASWVGYIGKMRPFRVTFHPYGKPDEKRTETVMALYCNSAMNKIKRQFGRVCCKVEWD